MTRSLDNFSLNPSGAHAEAGSTDVAIVKPADSGEGADSDFAVLLGKLKEHLGDRGYTAVDCFKSWNVAGNGLLIEQEAIDGLMQTNLGLQVRSMRSNRAQQRQQYDLALTMAVLRFLLSGRRCQAPFSPYGARAPGEPCGAHHLAGRL